MEDPYGVVAAFPHAPYDIQRDFMQALYETLDAGQIGLFESPTGKCALRTQQ
jgi:chromosome transmission fidelity protein 1